MNAFRKPMALAIPNPGFHESVWGVRIEERVASEAESIMILEDLEPQDADEKARAVLDIDGMRDAIAKEYAAIFCKWVREDLDVPDLTILFVRVVTPRSYNLGTDSIVVELHGGGAETLRRKYTVEELQRQFDLTYSRSETDPERWEDMLDDTDILCMM